MAINSQAQTLPAVTVSWQKRFFTIWGGQACSLLGSGVVQFAIIWWLTVTTNSGSMLAIASLMGLLPNAVLGPLAGTLVDRLSRRRVMIVADSLSAAASLALVVLFVTGIVQTWHVLAILFLRSLFGAFHQAAMQASTTLLVPQEQFTRVAGFNSTLSGGITLLSPILGALLVAGFKLEAIVMLDVVSALPAILPLFFFQIPQPASQRLADTPQGESIWRDFVQGLRYVRGWVGLMLLIGMALAINLLIVPATSLLPLLVRQLGGSAYHLAGVETVFGAGVIGGGLLLGVWGGFKRRVLTVLAGFIGLGIASLGIGMSGSIGLVMAGMFLAGAAATLVNGAVQAILQAVVEPGMQGRVFSLVTSAAVSVAPIGLLLAGPVSDALGVQVWYLAGGSICILAGIAGFFAPAFMRLETSPA